MGLIFLLFGGCGASSFIDFQGIQVEYTLDSSSPKIKGVITDIWESNLTVNDEVVLAYDFMFASQDLGEVRGTSYGNNYSIDVSDSVLVVYDQDQPSISKVEGLDASLGGYSSLLILIFPIVGLIIIVSAFIKKKR